MAGPTLISYNEKGDWTSVGNPSTTTAFAVQNGDLILVMLGEENAFQCTVTSVATSPSFGTLTQLELRENTSNTSLAGAYYIVATSSQASVTASFTTSQNNEKGICAWVFRDHNGIGAHAIGIDQTQPSVALTTTQANSTICCFGSDWAAIDGARTYRQINGANPTERHYQFGSGSWTGYAYEYADAGGIGSVTAGMTAPASQQAQTPVVEVLGVAGAPPPPPTPFQRIGPDRRAGN